MKYQEKFSLQCFSKVDSVNQRLDNIFRCLILIYTGHISNCSVKKYFKVIFKGSTEFVNVFKSFTVRYIAKLFYIRLLKFTQICYSHVNDIALLFSGSKFSGWDSLSSTAFFISYLSTKKGKRENHSLMIFII